MVDTEMDSSLSFISPSDFQDHSSLYSPSLSNCFVDELL